ncbi:glycosyltransferase [Verrucomicrobiota bacterium]
MDDNKKIIICAPHVWNTPYKVGCHHYTRCFSDKGWDVAYLSAPISPFHILYYLFSSRRTGMHMPQRCNSWRKGGEYAGKAWTYVPFGFIPVANCFPFNTSWAIRNAGKALVPSLKKKLKQKGFDRADVIWIDSPLFGYLLDMIPHKRSVLRVADNLSGFPELGRNVIEAENKLAGQVDVVAVTSALLEKQVAEAGAREIVRLPNGVDFGCFANDTHPEPVDITSIPRPRAVYVGSIERWFDDSLLTYAAQHRSNISFVIIGPHKKDSFPELERLPNVYFLGKREHKQIPAYLKHSDVGLIPFKKLPRIDYANPIKLYEYMAGSLPVVSTIHTTLKELGSPALFAETEESFVNKLDEALRNASSLKEESLKFAKENTWAKRVEIINQYL